MPLRAPRGFIDETDPKVCQIGHPAPAWMVNYADLMTEMVCFFVILYALSAALNKDVQTAAKEAKEKMEKEKVEGEVKVDQDGMHWTIEEQKTQAFFASGSADLTPRMEEILAKVVAPVLRPLAQKQDIIVEGHTDNQRISNDYFDSNWELSTARATNVVRTLIDSHRFPAKFMAAMGYGEFRPAAPNDSPENRQKNRRVVFWIKNMPLKPEEAPPAKEAGPGKAGEPAPVPAPPAETEPAPAPGGEAPAEAPPLEESPQ
ncbi:MAG: flagellar motor protein MotB [Elusimicrobia bacterium]|nr:flagellar motor protein MotB [Elusimicrobiota bacterium]